MRPSAWSQSTPLASGQPGTVPTWTIASPSITSNGPGGSVRDEDPPTGQVDVAVVERAVREGRDVDEAQRLPCHGYDLSAACVGHHA
jgi:hypothetical protein